MQGRERKKEVEGRKEEETGNNMGFFLKKGHFAEQVRRCSLLCTEKVSI